MVQFKKIKLIGFKSFADKTEIPLTDGVTCIVGPNGCGKSNVADAIRWVLGEQSAKVMRGTQMMDVIFNGTEKRKKTSFCEVTLTFDNTNHIFDYDAEEIEMTRRLYRDGTSEYLLNQQPSRMKILTGLLHGAGAAKEGYSIIGQGRIAQIMNSRPEERRSIFEEATGIVVFKDRKADAERRLAYSRDNLFVFAQRMAEVERQLTPLSKQAEAAKKYNELFNNLKINEINTYIFRHDGSEGEREKITARINKIAAQIEEQSARAASLLTEYEQCRESLAGADERLKTLHEKRLEYTVGLERSTGDSKIFKERANVVKAKLRQTEDDIAFASKRMDDVDREIKRNEIYAARNSERIAKLRVLCEALQAEIKSLSESIASYEMITGEHRKKVLAAFRDLSEIKENIGSLAAKKELFLERLSEMREAMQAAKREHEQLKKQYDETVGSQNELNKYLDGEGDLLEKAESEAAAAEEKFQSFVKRVYDTEAQLVSLGESLKTYTALRDRFEGYVYSVRRLLSDARSDGRLSSKIMGTIADVVSCDKQYEIAVETAFGGAMQNIITETRDDSQYLIEYLKANRAGKVTFLPIDGIRPRYETPQIKSACNERGAIGCAIDLVRYDPKYENVIHNLLGNTLVCDDIASANAISKRYPRMFKIVTLDGDLIATSGSMTGGSVRENAANLIANERKIKEIEDAISQNKSSLERIKFKREEAAAELAAAKERLENLESKLQNAHVEGAAAKQKLSSLMLNMTDKESEYTVYKQSIAEMEKRLALLDSEYTGVSAGAEDLSAQSEEANSEIDSMSEQNEKIIRDRAEKTEKLTSHQMEIASLESAVKSSNETIERAKKEKADLIERMTDLSRLLPDLERERDEYIEKAARAALTDDEKIKLDEIKNNIFNLEADKKTLNDRIVAIDKARAEVNELLEDLHAKHHKQEMDLQKIDSDLEHLKQSIEEDYGETYESCLQYKIDDFDVGQASSLIISLKRQITALGPVNPTAIEDYELIRERYETMSAEKADLEKAIEDLEKVLEDIKSEMLRIFNDGFNTINENFKRTFKELFGGGRAELQLDYTNCEDPLDAGVEIVACPPGKNLAKISLLSGGEQALTAIAILFAIIQMRPMPFCVLDEIEAALDDANVGRYAAYLKKFAADTQFIVITHRKPTMEKADVLFGVTMEEKGVSKIVSVKLSEVESRLGGDTVS